MPALLLTYLGIGSLLLRDPQAIRSPFFLLAPDALQLPHVLLATLATVIASQALIGRVSLTLQAVQLGYAPLTRIVYTSPTARGQVYVPLINWCLMIACIGLVIVFGSSSRLAAAFGLSVTGTMFITTVLFAVYARRRWGWNLVLIGMAAGAILLVEGAFLVANMFKIPDGGWFPLVAGAAILTLLTTWKSGRALVATHIQARRTPLTTFIAGVAGSPHGDVTRVPGIAVFLYSQRGTTPPGLAALVRATGALHQHVYVVSIIGDEVPRVHPARRIEATDIGHGVHQVALHYGFMTRHASDVATYFHIPAERVIEPGVRVEI